VAQQPGTLAGYSQSAAVADPQARAEEWVVAADIYEGRLFRPVTKGGKLAGQALSDEKAIWYIVLKYAKATSWGSCRLTICGGPAGSYAARRVAISSKFNCSWGMRQF
jgi:hypothetical protein